MAFPKSLTQSWVVKSLASAGTNFTDLLPFQMGIFDRDTHKALTAEAVAKKRTVYFGVGSPNTKQFTQGTKQESLFNPLNADINFSSDPVAVSRVEALKYQTPRETEKTNVYYLGYNGLDECESLNFECGKTYSFQVQVKGRPVRSIFQHEMREVISVTTDCCDDCVDTCASGVGCEKYIDELVANFNDPNRWTSRFFLAEKVIHCSPALPSLTTTSFNKYTLTVCDNGNELSLAEVQNQYPTLKVNVVSRSAPYTTYEVIKTSSAPAAFTQTSIILQNCATCPSGFTANAAGYAYIVEIDDANPSGDLASVQAVWATVTSATQLSFANGVSTHYVVSSATLSAPGATVDARIVQTLGTVAARCTQTTPTSTSWVANGTVYKVQRDLCITLKVDDCDADHDGADAGETLARLAAYYADVNVTVAGSLAFVEGTNCLLRYTISQYNTDYLVDGCDTYAVAKFIDLATFEGQRWDVCPCVGWTVDGVTGCPIPPVPTDRCCQCGIKFTGRPTTELLDKFAGYDINTFLEKDPIEMTVTVWRDDVDTSICKGSPTWFQAQRATYRQMRGDDVVKQIILERFYDKNPWVNQISKENQLLLQREGIKLGVDVESFFYAVTVFWNMARNENNTAAHTNTRYATTFYIDKKDLTTVDALRVFLAEAFPMAELEGYV